MMKRPYFLWDYDLTEEKTRKILRQGTDSEKCWLMARILEHAHFNDVFQYLTLKNILAYFPRLKMRPVIREYWQRALLAWGYHV
jgi:hypothetical protein